MSLLHLLWIVPTSMMIGALLLMILAIIINCNISDE